MDDILNEKKQDNYFKAEMKRYAKPTWKILLGCIFAAIVGSCATLFGWMIMEVMNDMNVAPLEGKSALDEAAVWLIIMALQGVILLIAKGAAGIFLSNVAENIVKSVREDLYEMIIRKDIGWHDLRDNSAGIMTSTLASDVQLLSGISSDGVSVQIEAFSALLTALIGGFIFSWPMTLVGLAVVPLIGICGFIVAKADNEAMMNVKEKTTDDDVSDDQKAS